MAPPSSRIPSASSGVSFLESTCGRQRLRALLVAAHVLAALAPAAQADPASGRETEPDPTEPGDAPIWRPDHYFFAEGFLITTRPFPEAPEATAPAEARVILRTIWAWAAPLPTTSTGIQLAATTVLEASILQYEGSWGADTTQYRLCFGLAAWRRRISVWNQVGRCYSPAKEPYSISGPDPMVGFASVFWAYRLDNPSRHFGWRTDVNLRVGGSLMQVSGMLSLDEDELTQRGSERLALGQAVSSLVWRFPNACRALGLLNYSFASSTGHYGALHAACDLWGVWEWSVGGIVGGPRNENGHGLQILNKIHHTLPNGQSMELIGAATTSFLRWAGRSGQQYSLGGEGTWRFSNGVGLTAGAFRVWLDPVLLTEGARRAQTETEFFMNASLLYE